MEACLEDELPATTELEEALRNGVMLARLSHFFAPEVVPKRRIYDIDLKRFEEKGLHFKHTDNINYWVNAMGKIGLPSIFYPTTTDIYDRKNMPKVVYCIHALRYKAAPSFLSRGSGHVTHSFSENQLNTTPFCM